MTTRRGADAAPRAPRGAPSTATKHKRADKKKEATRKAAKKGYNNLFLDAAGAQESTTSAAAAGANAGAPEAGEGDDAVRLGHLPAVEEPAEHELPPGDTPPGGTRARPPRARPPRAGPDLGLDSEDDDDDDDAEVDEAEPTGGHSQRAHAAVASRLQIELAKKGTATDVWLLRHLRRNGWWLRAGSVELDAAGALVKVNQGQQSPHYRMIDDPQAQADVFYDRDLLVCLPDEMWGMDLTCPSCGATDGVKVHGWSTQPARRVKDIFKDYDVMGRRHCCNHCLKVWGVGG